MAVDLFANAANTTLTAGIAAGATSLTVTSSTPFPAVTTAAATQFRVIIDAELFIVTNVTGLTWTVTPGAEGTTQAAHANGATVTALLTAGGVAGLRTPVLNFTVPSGRFMRVPQLFTSQNGGIVTTANRLQAASFALTGTNVITSMSYLLWGNGSAGAVVRLGIYADTNGYPGSLILDAGTVQATAGSNGQITITLGTSLSLGAGIYHTAFVAQGSPATNPTALVVGATSSLMNTATLPGSIVGWTTAGVAGALPTPFPAGATPISDGVNSGQVAIVMLGA